MAGVIKQKHTKVMNSKAIGPRSRIHQWFSFGWKFLAGLATLLGLITTLYSMSARVTVSSDSPIDLQSPFSSPFNIENCSIFPIYNIQFSCTLRDVKWQNDTRVINIRTRTDAIPIKRMDAGEITTTFCKPLPFKTIIKSADIEVEVKYRPAYLPWSKGRSFRFGTITESNGTLRWVPKALLE